MGIFSLYARRREKKMDKKEIWKDVKDYEGLYRISNLGRVKSLIQWNGNEYINNERIINGWVQNTRNGYKRKVVLLVKNNKRKQFKIHRLVAEVFIENPYNKPFINHIDGNPLNNNVTNLEWCTQSENVHHARKNKLRIYPQDNLNHSEIIEEYLKTNASQVCKKYGITKTILYDILGKHNVKTHGNKKYSLDLEEVLKDFKQGMRNVDIAKKHKCSTNLINQRKHQFKKGGIL